MLERDLRAHSAAQTRSGPVIFDRGVPDILGYLPLCGLPVPPRIAEAVKALRYNRRVFLAPYWDAIFTQDTERRQTHTEAEATSEVMRETYVALGYEITELPLVGVVQRANFVASQLDS